MTKLSEVTKIEFNEIIIDHLHNRIKTIIAKHCANPNTITIVEDLFDDTIDRYADNKINKIINQSCEIIQDKANIITATFD